MKVAVVGGGAAGCFCAINLRRMAPSAEVYLFEAGEKTLAKVAVTGGGRCNLTNSFGGHIDSRGGFEKLGGIYPRGENLMKRALMRFGHADTMDWFENEGIALALQEDGCVFPASQDAGEIVGKLQYLMRRTGVKIHTGSPVASVKEMMKSFDAVVVAVGGKPSASGYGFLDGLDLEIEPPCPSLYTFELCGSRTTAGRSGGDTPERGGQDGISPLKELAGIVVNGCAVSITGTAFRAEGALLITDWGVSGPAVLRLSSFAARHLAGCGFKAGLTISWCNAISGDSGRSTDITAAYLRDIASRNPDRQVANTHQKGLSSRLWQYLTRRSGLRSDIRWKELGTKGFNRLVNTLSGDCYTICGKGRYKEEFVTCGGVALSNLNLNTLEARKYPGLYFAGEILDIDAVTGGFNLQAAWSTGYVVAESIARGIASR